MTFFSGNLFVGERLRLASITPDDAEVIARWSQNSEYLRLMDSDIARPLSQRYFAKQDNEENHNFGVNFRLRTLADDKLIGFVVLHSIEWNNQTAMLAIGIGDPDDWGKGYGTEAMQLILRYGFTELNLYRIGLNVFSYNERAIRTYKKVGFVHEGTRRGIGLRDGQRYDLYDMGILRDEWYALNHK